MTRKHRTESLGDRLNREHFERCHAAVAAGLPIPRKPPMCADVAREVVAEQLAARKPAEVARSLKRFLRIGTNFSDEARAVYLEAIRKIEGSQP